MPDSASSDGRWAIASCSVGSNGSPSGENRWMPDALERGDQLVADQREALDDVVVAARRDLSASSRWSSAGSSSLASFAAPRSAACAFSRAIRLR